MLLEKIVSVGTNASNKERERETKLQHKNDSPPRVFSAREREGGGGEVWEGLDTPMTIADQIVRRLIVRRVVPSRIETRSEN